MRQVSFILISFIMLISIVGCGKRASDVTQLNYEPLSQKEEYLLNVTGNKVLMYELKELPLEKNYDLTLTYVVYEKGKKVKEEVIAGMTSDSTSPKTSTQKLILNLQENQIRSVWGYENSSASGKFETVEKLSNYAQTFLTQSVKLNLDSEIFLYHAHTGNNSAYSMSLGEPIDENKLKVVVSHNETNVFIKLSFKEVE